MGKRSDFPRNKHDFYATPYEAAAPLAKIVVARDRWRRFVAPCAGAGDLIRHLESFGFVCDFAFDIEPLAPGIERLDVFDWNGGEKPQLIITNPPWSRDLLHPMIEKFANIAPTYLLFDADWAHTRQAVPYLPYCTDIWPIGRVKWIPGSPSVGKDNACWYRFNRGAHRATVFHPRGS